MSRASDSSFPEEAVGLLVEHFGIERIRAALSRVANGAVDARNSQASDQAGKPNRRTHPSVPTMLEEVRQQNEERFRLLSEFYEQLKNRTVLPESQDIRQFAQIVGLKEISGKSRKDLLPPLMRFLVQLPTERLIADLEKAGNISEEQRQQG